MAFVVWIAQELCLVIHFPKLCFEVTSCSVNCDNGFSEKKFLEPHGQAVWQMLPVNLIEFVVNESIEDVLIQPFIRFFGYRSLHLKVHEQYVSVIS